MELSNEQYLKVVNFLTDKKCPFCGGSYSVEPYTYQLKATLKDSKGMVLEKELIYCACQNCHNVALFNAFAMGIS